MTRKEKKKKLEERITKEASDLVMYILEYYKNLLKEKDVSPKIAWKQSIQEANNKLQREVKRRPQEKDVIMRVGRESARILDEVLIENTKRLEARREEVSNET